jgi:MoxR-like ATPase
VNISDVQTIATKIRTEIGKAVVGQTEAVDLLLTALFAGGHVLLEGPPGTAKTLLARCFAASVGLDYGRIQFTPDLMPADIIGTNLFNFQTSEFTLTKGPLFCELLLADEINRTPPKTQAALLEAMQERRVTIDGNNHSLSDRFTVVATQNPIEQQGTYPLPEAQLDRFLFKHVLDYPTKDEEIDIIAGHGARTSMVSPASLGVGQVVSSDEITQAVACVADVHLTQDIITYIVELVRATRMSADTATGASPRAGAMMAIGARARAALMGRAYVLPDDVKALAIPVLAHRIVLSPVAEIEGRSIETIVNGLVEQVAVPR